MRRGYFRIRVLYRAFEEWNEVGFAALSAYLKVVATLEKSRLDFGQLIVAEVELAQKLEILKLPRAKHRVDVVPQQVVSESNVLQSVLDAVKEPLGQPPDLIVRKVHSCEGKIARREELRPQCLDSGVLLRKLLDVESVGEEGELGEDGAVAIDAGGVEVVEPALARVVHLRVELAARDLDGRRHQWQDRKHKESSHFDFFLFFTRFVCALNFESLETHLVQCCQVWKEKKKII